MCNKNISSSDLLDELIERVKIGEIKVDSSYLYDVEKYEVRFYNTESGVIFSRDWDVKKSAEYRVNYETYYLPLISQQLEKKQN